MSSLASPCFLLPHGAMRSSVYACIPVDASVTTRSPVLSKLTERSGLVELPDGVTLDDFHDWCTVTPSDAATRTLEELATALWVGEIMQDVETARELQIAQAMARKVNGTEWRDWAHADGVLQAVNALSQRARYLVYRQWGNMKSCQVLRWPVSLQQDYFNMRVMSKDVGALTISPHENGSVSPVCHASLALLLGTAPAPPGLHSLHISGGVFNSASAALLSHALLNHSCLSHLSAPTLSWKPAAFAPSPAEAIYTILPQLSHLTSLTLSIAACASTPNSITIATIRSLASAISALPALASLVLSRVSANVSSNTCGTIDRAAHGDARVVKRRRHTRYIGRPEVLTLDPVIAALSTAPALTALCLTCSQTMPSQNIPCSGIAGPFSSLCRLHLHFQAPDDYSRNVTRSLNPSNRIVHIAPMPALQSVTLSARHPFDKGDALVSTIISSAAQQPALTALRLELGRTCPSDSFHEAPAAQFQTSMSDEQLVKVDAAWLPTPARLHALVSELARLTRLHSLELQVVDHQLRLKGAASDNHPSMLQPLLGIQKLQDLCLRFEGPKKDTADTMMLALLAAPETALSKLTALSFRFEGSIHTAVVLSPKLPQLTALRRLSLWGLRCEAMKEVLASLRTSPQLEELEVVLQPVDGAVVRWFAEFAAQMPQLCVGRLGSSQTGPAEHVGKSYGPRFAMPDWIEGLLHLPGRGKFVIDVENGQVMEGALAVVREALENRGARVSRDCRQVEFQS